MALQIMFVSIYVEYQLNYLSVTSVITEKKINVNLIFTSCSMIVKTLWYTWKTSYDCFYNEGIIYVEIYLLFTAISFTLTQC